MTPSIANASPLSTMLPNFRRRVGGLLLIAAAALLATACGLFYCSSCFPAGTLVRTPIGAVPIETLEIGDPVLSWDLESGSQVVAAVVDTHVHESDPDLFTIMLADGRSVVATADHPFWRPEAKDWARADALAVGDALAMRSEVGRVEDPPTATKIAAISRSRNSAPVYNIEVSGPGTYFAADALVKYY